MPQVATGLRIAQIHNQASGSRNTGEEWVLILNDGPHRWQLASWLVTDETSQQLRPHIFRFPLTVAGAPWVFEPQYALYVITGDGTDQLVTKSGNRPMYCFYWNRDAFVWNNRDDLVMLRHPNGEFATQPLPCP